MSQPKRVGVTKYESPVWMENQAGGTEHAELDGRRLYAQQVVFQLPPDIARHPGYGGMISDLAVDEAGRYVCVDPEVVLFDSTTSGS